MSATARSTSQAKKGERGGTTVTVFTLVLLSAQGWLHCHLKALAVHILQHNFLRHSAKSDDVVSAAGRKRRCQSSRQFHCLGGAAG